MQFKLYDRVEAIVNYPFESDYIVAGDLGTVCDFDDDGYIGVAWDKPLPEGHDCSGNCEHGYGWYVHELDVKLYEGCEEEPVDMREFQKGDRVEIIVDNPSNNPYIWSGDVGIIRGFGTTQYAVEMDHFVNGHVCDGSCEEGYGWYVSSKNLRLYKERPEEDIDEKSFFDIILPTKE